MFDVSKIYYNPLLEAIQDGLISVVSLNEAATSSGITSAATAGKVKTCCHPLQCSHSHVDVSQCFVNEILRIKISWMTS